MLHKKAIIVGACLVVLSGCYESTVTVDYYLENLEELDIKIADCKTSADKRSTTNCKNAFSAKAQETMRKFLNEGFER